MAWNNPTYLNARSTLWTNFSRSHYSQRLEDGRTFTITRLLNGVITTPPDASTIEYELLDKDEAIVQLRKLNVPSRTIDHLSRITPNPPAYAGEW